MDTQVAWGPRGHLHAVAPVHSEELAAAFLATMARQGCRVERLTEAEHRVRFLLAPRAAAPDPVREAPALSPAPDAPPAHEVPDVGVELVHPLLGRATVTHHVTLPEGLRLAVARGPGGEGLVREWSPVVAAPPAPAPTPLPPPPAYQPVRGEMPRLF